MAFLPQYHALSVLRLTDQINQLDKSAPDYDNKFSWFVAIKEEQAEKFKAETRIIWGDYFKPDVYGDNFTKQMRSILLREKDIEPAISEIMDGYTERVSTQIRDEDLFRGKKVPKRETREIEPSD